MKRLSIVLVPRERILKPAWSALVDRAQSRLWSCRARSFRCRRGEGRRWGEVWAVQFGCWCSVTTHGARARRTYSEQHKKDTHSIKRIMHCMQDESSHLVESNDVIVLRLHVCGGRTIDWSEICVHVVMRHVTCWKKIARLKKTLNYRELQHNEG